MAKGPKPAELRLSEEERNELEALVRRHSTPQQLAKRGRMILGAADGNRNAQIARELEANVDTVCKWRMHWIGLQAVTLEDLSVSERLADLPRPGRPSETHGRTNLSDDRAGVRTTQRASHQSLDREGNR